MNLPKGNFHTDTLGDERVFWADAPLLFHISDEWPTVEVGAKYVSDGFSIPKTLRGFFATAPAGHSLNAAILHDWLYSKDTPTHGLTRRGVDKLFKVALRAYGVSRTRSFLIHTGVRLGGWVGFRKRPPIFRKTDDHKPRNH